MRSVAKQQENVTKERSLEEIIDEYADEEEPEEAEVDSE